MAETKTKPTHVDVSEFIESFCDSEQKKADSRALIEMMQKITGKRPVMWGPSIIGFGSYHYKYASGHEGDSPILGFSPRKSALTLYVHTGRPEHEHLLRDLGKVKVSKACIYAKKLSDINLISLSALMHATFLYMTENYPHS